MTPGPAPTEFSESVLTLLLSVFQQLLPQAGYALAL